MFNLVEQRWILSVFDLVGGSWAGFATTGLLNTFQDDLSAISVET